jgi:hypothetical protein
MKLAMPIAAITLAILQAGCATIPGALGGGADQEKTVANAWEAIKAVMTDPNCGHEDELNLVFSPMPSGNVHLKRACEPLSGPAVPLRDLGSTPPPPHP